jgi:hypothetical protein
VTNRNEALVVTASSCAVAAPMALAVGAALGAWRGGMAVGLGLLVGATNGFMARRALGAEIGFGAASLGRLAILSIAALGLGALLGLQFIPLVLLGVAAAQIVLAVAAAVSAVRT